jgi:hypothetical protein
VIYELRIYRCFGGQLPKLHKRFGDHTLKLFEKHGMKNIGYWTNVFGPSQNELFYLLAFPDLNARMKSFEAFQADPEWIRVKAESEKDGLIVENVENRILAPTPYSPLQ